MSHIINNGVSENQLYEYLELIRNNGYTKDVLFEILNGIIPFNENFVVKSEIDNDGYIAYFSWANRVIHLNEEMLFKYINRLVDETIKMYPKLENYRSDLFSYIVMFVLCHEVEHVYQYMFGHDYIIHDYKLVRDLYKNMTEFTVSDKTPYLIWSILFSRYKRVKDKATFVLERNANIEAYDLLHKLSLIENNKDIVRFMYNQYMWYSACGYLKMKNNGSFGEAYRDSWRHSLFNSFDFSEDISVEERIRYGLPIDDNNRVVLLNKFIGTRENKH